MGVLSLRGGAASPRPEWPIVDFLVGLVLAGFALAACLALGMGG